MTSQMQHSLHIKIDRVTYANAATGYVVIRGKETTGRTDVTAVGILPDACSNTNLLGSEYELQGAWKIDSKYGKQFSFDQSRMVGNQLFYFLSRVVKGLGEHLARELITHYGEVQLIQILETEPERLTEFKGIKEKKLSKIKQSWEKQKSLREIADLLLPAGVTPNLLVRVYNHFGVSAVRRVKENPYCLTAIPGIGFKSADIVAQKLGIAFDSPFRIQAATLYVLFTAAEDTGHTCVPIIDVFADLREILNSNTQKVSDDGMNSAILDLVSQGKVISDERGVSITGNRQMEKWLLSFFRNRTSTTGSPIATPETAEAFIARSEASLGFAFSPEQKDVVQRIAAGKSLVYALLGYAGTGKSTISRAILDFLAEHRCTRDDIVCCAFTGMASARIRKLTGYPAFTIHSLLKYQEDGKFAYNKENRLPYKVILLDEASMVNLSLFYRLAQAIQDNALFIMVGDPAQLPPIGAGNVFCDITEKEAFPKTTLTAIFRQSSNSVLVHFANIIRQGNIPGGYEKEGYEDFSYRDQDIPNYFVLKKELPEVEIKKIRDANNEKIRSMIMETAADMARSLKHPSWDFQVLTPVRRGILGTEVLNPALQAVFNPAGKNPVTAYGTTFREGDKVVHLRNQDTAVAAYHPAMFNQDTCVYEKKRIFNGTVGIIMRIDHENEEFYVLYPERVVVRYDFDHIMHLIDLAYCLTVHKAQGSQYQYVAIPLSNSHYMMLNNKWFYTALTRAEKKVFLIGQVDAFRRACQNIDTTIRQTMMRGENDPW